MAGLNDAGRNAARRELGRLRERLEGAGLVGDEERWHRDIGAPSVAAAIYFWGGIRKYPPAIAVVFRECCRLLNLPDLETWRTAYDASGLG